jgi:hypothetical protein
MANWYKKAKLIHKIAYPHISVECQKCAKELLVDLRWEDNASGHKMYDAQGNEIPQDQFVKNPTLADLEESTERITCPSCGFEQSFKSMKRMNSPLEVQTTPIPVEQGLHPADAYLAS